MFEQISCAQFRKFDRSYSTLTKAEKDAWHFHGMKCRKCDSWAARRLDARLAKAAKGK